MVALGSRRQKLQVCAFIQMRARRSIILSFVAYDIEHEQLNRKAAKLSSLSRSPHVTPSAAPEQARLKWLGGLRIRYSIEACPGGCSFRRPAPPLHYHNRESVRPRERAASILLINGTLSRLYIALKRLESPDRTGIFLPIDLVLGRNRKFYRHKATTDATVNGRFVQLLACSFRSPWLRLVVCSF